MFRPASAALLFLLVACATAGPPTRPNDAEWKKLESEHAWLESMRNAVPVASPSQPRKTQIEARLELHRKLEPMIGALFAKIEEYYERTGDVRAARVYAGEKVRLGDEYMKVLARYDRAIAMYESALVLDPTSAPAKDGLAQAQSQRFMTLESFSRVRGGMKEEQVRTLLGMPREDWIKQVVQKSRVFSVWIYPRSDGGASAIYFDGGVVYHTNWNAAPAKSDSSR